MPGRSIAAVALGVAAATPALDAQWQRTETLAEPGALLEFTYVPASRRER